MCRTAITTVALCAVALAQKPASPTFEVASIKPAAPQEMGRMMTGMSGGPGTRDPTQVSFINANLKMILTQAYDVQNFQVTGPAFLDTEPFDITAKLAPGTSKADFRLMLQNLLAERFKVVLHKESKEAPIYALVVTKGGPKMKESEKIDPAAGDAPPPASPTMGKDGRPQMGRGGRGMRVMMGPKGLHLQAVQSTMDQLCHMLSSQLGRPVVDMTGLKAEYDYTLDFSPEGLGGMRGMGPGPLSGKEGPEGGPEGTVSIFTAVQDLGLKLESRKGPVDLIIVDSAEKTPTEN
jgi:uncharacterized protein (TIGR03435 family)